MKKPKGLREIHEIMEKIHEEEKRLNAEQRVKRLREESDKLSLKRVTPKELKHIVA